MSRIFSSAEPGPQLTWTAMKFTLSPKVAKTTNAIHRMIRTLARWWARRRYIFKQEFEAALEDLQAALSAQRAKEKRDLAAQLRKESDDMETRVKQMAEMEEKGFWLCDDGHEIPVSEGETRHKEQDEERIVHDVRQSCSQCGKEAKLIKRSDMTGQEQYESDKGRKEVETMIAEKRKLAEQHDTDAKGGDDTEKHFRRQAASSREVADRLRKL